MRGCKEIGGMYKNLTSLGAGGEVTSAVDVVFFAEPGEGRSQQSVMCVAGTIIALPWA